MAVVLVRQEVIEEGELNLVPGADLKVALRRLRDDPTSGKPLGRSLVGLRSIRVGGKENRLVYRIRRTPGEEDRVEVIAIGRRRDNQVYDTAGARS